MASLCLGFKVYFSCGSRISEKGFICIKVWGFALLILISHANEIIWSQFIFIGYLKTGAERGTP